MYGLAEYEVSRQHREEIQQAVAVYRLESKLRPNHEGRYRLMGNTKWELERYAGLFKKRLRSLG